LYEKRKEKKRNNVGFGKKGRHNLGSLNKAERAKIIVLDMQHGGEKKKGEEGHRGHSIPENAGFNHS